tara:strand:- start:12 stop:314 length:303 start_codon:yes stop_codon:yes gene_type:complete
MDINTRVASNNPVWDSNTTSSATTVAAAATPDPLTIPGGARYVIISPLVNDIIVQPTAANGDPGIAVGAGGSVEIALGGAPVIYFDVSVDGTVVNTTFFY